MCVFVRNKRASPICGVFQLFTDVRAYVMMGLLLVLKDDTLAEARLEIVHVRIDELLENLLLQHTEVLESRSGRIGGDLGVSYNVFVVHVIFYFWLFLLGAHHCVPIVFISVLYIFVLDCES